MTRENARARLAFSCPQQESLHVPTQSIATWAAIAALIQLVAGCSDNDGSLPERSPQASHSASLAPTVSGPVQPAARSQADGHPQPELERATMPERRPTTESSPPAESDLEFPGQVGWRREEPDNRMRLAQFVLPAQGVDGEDATLVVFSFGGPAGDVDSNLQRWIQMLEQPDGSDSSAVAKRTMGSRDGLVLHTVDIAGRYVAPTMPGGQDGADKPGWRLIGTVIEAGEKTYYVKLTGPQETVAHWRASYSTFLDQVDPPR